MHVKVSLTEGGKKVFGKVEQLLSTNNPGGEGRGGGGVVVSVIVLESKP